MAAVGFQVRDRMRKRLSCELCDTKMTCLYNCSDCNVHLCAICSRAHHRVTLTRDHKILTDKHESLPRSKAEPRCSTHTGEEIVFYCHTCVVFICAFCITSNHKCSVIKQASEEMSTELEYHSNNIKDNYISTLRSYVKLFENLQTRNQEQHESNVKNINGQTDSIVCKINDIRSKMIQESKEATNKNELRLLELQEIVEKKVEELKHKYTEYKNILTSGSDIDKIMARNEVLEFLRTYNLHTSETKIHNLKFITGEYDITLINELFGFIETVEGDSSDAIFFQTELAKNTSAKMLSIKNEKKCKRPQN